MKRPSCLRLPSGTISPQSFVRSKCSRFIYQYTFLFLVVCQREIAFSFLAVGPLLITLINCLSGMIVVYLQMKANCTVCVLFTVSLVFIHGYHIYNVKFFTVFGTFATVKIANIFHNSETIFSAKKLFIRP